MYARYVCTLCVRLCVCVICMYVMSESMLVLFVKYTCMLCVYERYVRKLCMSVCNYVIYFVFNARVV